MNWCKDLKGKVRRKELLRNHTSFKIGGPANFFIEPKDSDDLKLLLNLAKRYKIPILVIGAGSNILVSDKGVEGLVLHLNSPYFKRVSFENNYLQAGSGILLSRLVRLAQDHSLSGLEFLTGIPGTLGGALMMNAGISEKIKNQKSLAEAGSRQRFSNKRGKIKNIGDLIENVTVADFNGKIKTLNKKDIRFSYRSSNLSKYIILGAGINSRRGKKKEIKERIKRYLDFRKLEQDYSHPSAGCIFKNPPRYSAGRLIDLCGLKGRRIGRARISYKHANFILNLGNTSAGDVLRLMDLVKREVKDKFKINLKPEIKIWR